MLTRSLNAGFERFGAEAPHQKLHTEIYPGTEIMKDVGTHHFVKSCAGAGSVLVLNLAMMSTTLS